MMKTRFSQIAPSWKGFLKLFVCFAVFTNFSNTFLSTYLLKATGSQKSVMVFNIVLAGVQPFAMLIAVRLIRLRTPLFSQRAGLFLYAAAFLYLGIAGENAVYNIQWVAGVLSAANGFFYVTYALQLLAYAKDENRDLSYGVQSIISNTIGLILPTLSGLLLAAFTDFTGYRIMFFMGLAACAGAILFSTRLMPIRDITPKAQLGRALRVLVTDKAASAAMFTSMANGFYSGTMAFFLNMLMYSLIENEAVIGLAGTLGSVAAIFASFVYARVVNPENRAKSVVLSLGVMLACTLMLVVRVSLVTLFTFSVLLAGMNAFFLNPPLTAYVNVVERLPALKGLGGEVHALREFWYGSGRVLGILMTLCLSEMKNGAVLVIVIILASQLIPAFLMKRMEHPGDAR